MLEIDCCCFHWAEVPLEAQELPLINQISGFPTIQWNPSIQTRSVDSTTQVNSARIHQINNKIKNPKSPNFHRNLTQTRFNSHIHHPFRLLKNPKAENEIDVCSLDRPSSRSIITFNPKFQISNKKSNRIKQI